MIPLPDDPCCQAEWLKSHFKSQIFPSAYNFNLIKLALTKQQACLLIDVLVTEVCLYWCVSHYMLTLTRAELQEHLLVFMDNACVH